MYYSKLAWMYGFMLFGVTLASCLAFVLSTMDDFTYVVWAECPFLSCLALSSSCAFLIPAMTRGSIRRFHPSH